MTIGQQPRYEYLAPKIYKEKTPLIPAMYLAPETYKDGAERIPYDFYKPAPFDIVERDHAVVPTKYIDDHPELQVKAQEKPAYKYDEDRLLNELRTYIDSTYKGHYVGENNVQSLDLIFATGHGEGFTLGNCQKYSARAGKKKGQERADLLKIIHYGLLGLYLYDKNNKKDS